MSSPPPLHSIVGADLSFASVTRLGDRGGLPGARPRGACYKSVFLLISSSPESAAAAATLPSWHSPVFDICSHFSWRTTFTRRLRDQYRLWHRVSAKTTTPQGRSPFPHDTTCPLSRTVRRPSARPCGQDQTPSPTAGLHPNCARRPRRSIQYPRSLASATVVLRHRSRLTISRSTGRTRRHQATLHEPIELV